MRTTLARALLGIAATAVTTATATPAAHATTSDLIFGGCSYNTDQNDTVTGPDTYVGVVDDASATVDSAGTPVAATVSCQIRVNDVAAPGATFSYSGLGVQAGANSVSLTAAPTDVVDLCQRVVYADLTDTGWVCPTTDRCFVNAPCFPPGVNTLLDLVSGNVNNAFTSTIDPALCPVLAAHAGSYGPVTVAPDGDVYVPDPVGLGLNPIYDCLPYGNF
jgi:hypothetical protein